MKLIAVFFSLLLSLGAFAAPVCDFPYDLSEDEGVVELKRDALAMTTRLSALQKKQVIATATKFAETTPARRLSIKAALESLMNDSEGGDLYYIVFTFKGMTYNLVQYYPGGNPVGLVFKGTEVVAERQDGDLVCDNL